MVISSLFFILSCKNNVNNPNVYFQDQPITSYSGTWKGDIYDTLYNEQPLFLATIIINDDGSINYDGDIVAKEDIISKGNNTFEFILYDNLTLGNQIVALRYVNTLKITDNYTMNCFGTIDMKSGVSEEVWDTFMNTSGTLQKQQ
ncbi:hypothetical protein Bint_0199 [Brachyspira intermedia PWS/A]|uniref:Uncharacterized protein n=2 Tax=Brachyspira intermedia TaxID=84377 RepID=G0EQC8_BRAIP|nr:hypothetical protein Bint_0199 [Brachyspira intermedia PWS/A]